MRTFANSVDSDEMLLWAAFHQGFHYLSIKYFSGTVVLNMVNLACNLLICTRRPIVSIKME